VVAQRFFTRQITLTHVWLFAAIAFVVLRVLLTPIPPNDFWWHLATGREIVATGRIPTEDSFSYTRAGEPFYNQSWLAQVLMYGLYQAGGLPLLVFVQALVIGLAYWLLLRLCIERTGAPRLSAGVVMALTMPASFDNWIVRPQSYALLLFMATLYLLHRWRGGENKQQGIENRKPISVLRSLFFLPFIAAIWVNLHGSFVLGGALIGLTFVGEWLRRWYADRSEERAWANRPIGRPQDVLERSPRPLRPPLYQLFFCGLAVGAAWLLNPGGIAVLGYVRNLLGSSAVTQLVTEWAPPTLRTSGGILFFLFVMVGIVALAYAKQGPDLVDMLVAGVFFWLALSATRNNIWFCAVATPLIVGQLAQWQHGVRASGTTNTNAPGLPVANAALIAVIGLMVLLALPWLKPVLGLPPALGALASPETPVAAVEFLKQQPAKPQRLFNEMAYGSYLIWELPGQKVFVDPRIELYPLAQWQDYIQLSGGVNTEALLAKYQFDAALLDKAAQPALVAQLREQAGWKMVYEDEWSVYVVTSNE
jgi:hypothetical protein